MTAARTRTRPAAANGADERVDPPHLYETNLKVPVDVIAPNPANPRRDAERIDDTLLASIKAHGVIEPLVLRRVDANGAGTDAPGETHRFEVIAGHRRLSHARAAGFARVPAVVRDVDDADALEVMLAENLARADLAPLEEAQGFAALVGLGRTQRYVADLLGVSQSHVSKRLSLLELPAGARAALDKGPDSGGISVDDGVALAAAAKAGVAAEKIDAVARRGHSAGYYAQQLATTHKLEAAVAKKVAALRKDGRRAVAYAERLNGWERVERFYLDVDQTKHRAEPCSIVVCSASPYRKDVEANEWCSAPKRHAKGGDSKLKARRNATDRLSEAAKKNRQATLRVNKARGEARKAVLASKIARADEIEWAARFWLAEISTTVKIGVAKELGLEALPGKDYSGKPKPDFAAALEAWVKADPQARWFKAMFAWGLTLDWGAHREITECLIRFGGYTLDDSEKADSPDAMCRVCGCSDEYGCDGGCAWVEADLCSSCATGPDADVSKEAAS